MWSRSGATRRWTVAGLALAITLALTPLAWADPPGRVARLSYTRGNVSFLPGGLADWAPAAVNYPLTTGDAVWVDRDAWAELQIGSTALRLAPETSFAFLNLDDRTAQVRLTQGALLLRLRALGPGEIFEIDTPAAAVTVTRPGAYRIVVDPGPAVTTVTVRSGEAEITAAASIVRVVAGQALVLSGAETPVYGVRAPDPPDDWEAWAATRDQREDQALARRYVSPEVIGSEDLDDYGTWRVDATYGPVWTPTRVDAGWAPYRTGRWAWVDPWGWTWIDDAPWGFAPFHYGRWAFLDGRWGWVPGTIAARPVYAPALVVFVGGGPGDRGTFGPDPSIGWFPLAPREAYVPAYPVSAAYIRNLNVTNITNISVTNVNYRNRAIPGGVTVVSHDVFVGARPVAPAVVRVAPQTVMTAPVLGTVAPLSPRRESVLARPLRQVGVEPVRPPEAVRARPVVARVTPPPAPVPFAVRQEALETTRGRPLDPQTLESLRRTAPPAATMPAAVRPGVLAASVAPIAPRPSPVGPAAPTLLAPQQMAPRHSPESHSAPAPRPPDSIRPAATPASPPPASRVAARPHPTVPPAAAAVEPSGRPWGPNRSGEPSGKPRAVVTPASVPRAPAAATPVSPQPPPVARVPALPNRFEVPAAGPRADTAAAVTAPKPPLPAGPPMRRAQPPESPRAVAPRPETPPPSAAPMLRGAAGAPVGRAPTDGRVAAARIDPPHAKAVAEDQPRPGHVVERGGPKPRGSGAAAEGPVRDGATARR